MIIDHNKDEKRPTNTVWWMAAALLIFNWTTFLMFHDLDWWPVCLGLGSGVLLALWAVEMTGNKIPKSWSRSR